MILHALGEIAEVGTKWLILAGVALALYQARHNGKKVEAVKQQVAAVEDTVNGKSTEQIAQTARLTKALSDHGIDVPKVPHE